MLHRVGVLRAFNKSLCEVIDLINLNSETSTFSRLGNELRAVKHCIFGSTKQELLLKALQKTKHRSRTSLSVTFDNQRALHSRDKQETGISTSECIFVQGYNQLHSVPCHIFRQALDNKERLFNVRCTKVGYRILETQHHTHTHTHIGTIQR